MNPQPVIWMTKGSKSGSTCGQNISDGFSVMFHMPSNPFFEPTRTGKTDPSGSNSVPKCHLIGSTPYFEKSQVRLLWNNYIYDPLLVVKVSPPSWILFTTRLESQNRFTTSTSRKKVFVTNSRDRKRDVTCQYSDV